MVGGSSFPLVTPERRGSDFCKPLILNIGVNADAKPAHGRGAFLADKCWDLLLLPPGYRAEWRQLLRGCGDEENYVEYDPFTQLAS